MGGNQSHQRQHSDPVLAAGPGFNNITMQVRNKYRGSKLERLADKVREISDMIGWLLRSYLFI